MPQRKYHLMFDELLKEKKVICKERNTNTVSVHNFMDKGAKKWGPKHRLLDPKHDAEMIRPWIAGQIQKFGTLKQETATDFVRIAWGHIVLDFVVTIEKDVIQGREKKRMRDNQLDWNHILKMAWKLYKAQRFDRTYYKGSKRGLLEHVSHWLFGRDDRARKRR